MGLNFHIKNNFRLCVIFLCLPFSAVSQENGFPFIRNYSPIEFSVATQFLTIAQDTTGIKAGQCRDLMEYTAPGNKKILLAGTQNGIYEIIGTQAGLIRGGNHAMKVYVSPSNPCRIFSTDLPRACLEIVK